MPTLSILVPVYNEERTIGTVMNLLARTCPDAEVIYVDDGSKDGSLAIMKNNARPQDTVLTKENGGKGSAIRMGLSKASGTFTVIQDADTEYDPSEIALLLEEAKKSPNVAVFGSRFLRENPNIYKRYLFGNKLITGLVNILFGSRLTDSYTCYKLFPTELMRSFPLTARGFELEAELCAYPLMRKISIREIPISYRPRSLEEGKKIRPADAWKGFKTLLRIRLGRA
jgi:glycosyltransferase involved in cell wall biosynthesis